MVISGPSGVGKSTVCGRLLKLPGSCGIKFERSVSATTRKMRRNEKEGVDYYFIAEKKFGEWLKQRRFLEHADIAGARYGTLKSELKRISDSGSVPLLTLDPQGVLQLKRKKVDAVYIFLLPPRKRALKERLEKRSTETAVEMKKRIKLAESEMEYKNIYDYRVVNDDIDRAVGKILEISLQETKY